MALTLSNIILLIFLFICGLCISGLVAYSNEKIIFMVIGSLITTIICIIIMLIFNWYNTSMATGIRRYKDYKSELSNGINREIVITAEDGREIFRYSGKVDIESNHTDNYIKFESEEGKRYIIYYGIQDTIQIIEK